MKSYPPRIVRRSRHLRVPAFLPVPLRARADGWTPARQAAFLGHLAATGSVEAAARRIGMARETAYRLRRKPGAESFAAAWDVVTGKAGYAERRKVAPGELARRALGGLIKPMMWRGEYAGIANKPDNSALLAYLRQLDRGASGEPDRGGRSQSLHGAVVSHKLAARGPEKNFRSPLVLREQIAYIESQLTFRVGGLRQGDETWLQHSS